jgi:hypothetical protein
MAAPPPFFGERNRRCAQTSRVVDDDRVIRAAVSRWQPPWFVARRSLASREARAPSLCRKHARGRMGDVPGMVACA